MHTKHPKKISPTTSTKGPSDLLKKIRESRRKPSSQPIYTSQTKKQRPLIIRCFIPAIIIVVILYIFLFVEVGELDIFEFLHNPHQTLVQTQPLFIHDTNHTYATYQDDADNSHFVSMWHYIHQSDFNKLSHALQTRKLHELFRYKYTDILVERIKSNTFKLPTDYELAVIMTDLYNSWHQSEINFIQIGACDGNWAESNDPIQKLILTKPNWHGVMMEPVPYLYQTLTENIKKEVVEYEHRILPINAALSDEDGTQIFYIVNEHFREELPNESHALKYQIGSFNREHITKHIGIKKERGQLKEELDHYITGIKVKSLTPNSVLQLFRMSNKAARDGTIDVVSIDAEGYDLVVLKQFLENTAMRPLLIMYEHLHLSDDDKQRAVDMLREHGYLDFKMYWNTLGVRVANI